LPTKTKARARMPPPFLQRSCVLRSRFEAVFKGSETLRLHGGNQRQGRVRNRAATDVDVGEIIVRPTAQSYSEVRAARALN